jgi:hypothetical protein
LITAFNTIGTELTNLHLSPGEPNEKGRSHEGGIGSSDS